MAGNRSQIAGLLLLALLSLGVASSAQTVPSRRSQKKSSKPVQVQPAPEPQPVPPPPPPTLEQMPANPPHVTFQNGQLTILAPNYTLGDILQAVHTKTGADIDVPGNATERVVGRLGPGPARDVMASLLNGTHFNYVMLGSVSNPNGLERVVLTPRTAAPGGSASPQGVAEQPTVYVSNPPLQGTVQGPPQQQPTADSAEGVEDSEGATEDDNAADQPEDQPQNPPQPNVPGGVKTPEQLLQELQRQQRQQQQPPQGVPAPNPGTPPQQQPPPEQ